MTEQAVLAPGARVVVRDEEWLVRSSVPVATGGFAIRVVGMSELVRNQERSFLTALDTITEMRPEDTDLVADASPQYRRSRLYLESLLRRTPPTDDRVCPPIGHWGLCDPASAFSTALVSARRSKSASCSPNSSSGAGANASWSSP
jgi:hypothetical protein